MYFGKIVIIKIVSSWINQLKITDTNTAAMHVANKTDTW